MKKFSHSRLISSLGAVAIFLLPAVAFAQRPGGIRDFMLRVGGLINLLLPIAAGLALLYFFYGMAKFVRDSGDEDGREAGKMVMVWGIVALFVISSLWAVVAFIRSNLGIQDINRLPVQTPIQSPR